jgi:hypothetical protein
MNIRAQKKDLNKKNLPRSSLAMRPSLHFAAAGLTAPCGNTGNTLEIGDYRELSRKIGFHFFLPKASKQITSTQPQ